MVRGVSPGAAGGGLADRREHSGSRRGRGTGLFLACHAAWRNGRAGGGRADAFGRNHRDNEVISSGSSRFYRRLVVQENRLIGYLALGERQPGGLVIKRLIDEQIDIREISASC